MSDKRRNHHIDPDTLKECYGFKYIKNGNIGCLSCNWNTEPKRKTDKDLPDKMTLDNTWH